MMPATPKLPLRVKVFDFITFPAQLYMRLASMILCVGYVVNVMWRDDPPD